MSGEAPSFGGDVDARYQRLDAGWRRHLSAVLGLPLEGFQLVHGMAGRSDDEAALHRLCDANPPAAPVLRWTGASGRTVSGAYGRLLGALRPESDAGLQGILGRDYARWVAWRNARADTVSPETHFAVWSAGHLEGRRLAAARRAFAEEAAIDPVHAARARLSGRVGHLPRLRTDGRIEWLPAYAPGTAATRAALFPLRTGTIDFDSDGLAEEAPAGTAVGGPPRILPGSVSGCLDPLERRALSGRITVTGNIAARAAVAADPGAWFDADLVAAAQASGPDGPAWDPLSNAGGWSTFFGSSGLLARRTLRLVFVTGYELTVRLAGPFAEDEMADLARLTARGIWPVTDATSRPDHVCEMFRHAGGSVSLRLRQRRGALMCCARILPQGE